MTNKWLGKKVAVVGLGISNTALIRYLAKKGAAICGRDRKTVKELGKSYQELQQLCIDFRLGTDYLVDLDKYDAVFLTPGIPKHLPGIAAIKGKVPILSEISLLLQEAKAPVIGITGSSGKTTTTALVGEILKASGFDCYVGGNIGNPLIELVDQIPPQGRIVLELSSFQLELLNQSPELAVVTNISENHLDIHQTMDNYINAKKQIYLHQRPTDFTVFNFDDPITAAMAEESLSRVYFFSNCKTVMRGTYVDENDQIVFRDQAGIKPLIAKQDIELLGEHNVQNVLAAALLAILAGSDLQAIKKTVTHFPGIAHRLEKVDVIDDVTYINDSIATSPTRAIAGIRSFTKPLILIAGGYDKNLSFITFAGEVGGRVKDLILLGQTAPMIEQAVLNVSGTITNIHRVDDLEKAINLATRIAEPGDVVLFSPACASFDQYPNFEVRGDHFRSLVAKIACKES